MHEQGGKQTNTTPQNIPTLLASNKHGTVSPFGNSTLESKSSFHVFASVSVLRLVISNNTIQPDAPL